MLDLIIEKLKHTDSSNELIRRAKGYYQLPTSFKEFKKVLKLRCNG
jgi:hypothetical protein